MNSPERVIDREILERPIELQGPYPWGDLTKEEGVERFPMEVENSEWHLPYIPIGLSVGCGLIPSEAACRGVADTMSFGYLLDSDLHHPSKMPKNYV
jgi:hypothetical protein